MAHRCTYQVCDSDTCCFTFCFGEYCQDRCNKKKFLWQFSAALCGRDLCPVFLELPALRNLLWHTTTWELFSKPSTDSERQQDCYRGAIPRTQTATPRPAAMSQAASLICDWLSSHAPSTKRQTRPALRAASLYTSASIATGNN